MKHVITLCLAWISSVVFAHEFTPTYITFKPSFREGVYVTEMKLFNKRSDTSYYEIEVFDKDRNGLPFATASRVLELPYLETKTFEIYIRKEDLNKVMYVCTKSKIVKDDKTSPLVMTRVCSKVK